ncbi:Vasoactive intestinal polypeptide receptor 2 [Nymphon striatum]|nr:Vasoactive intestinal polypeptide receptor 2 [Nymphon striatum]
MDTSGSNKSFNLGMKKWIKSTLVLVPLFGAYYIILLIVSLSVGNNETATVAWLYCDTTFTAFQGFVVAVLYCFVNSEVQAEIRRKYQSINAEFGTNQSYLTQTQTRIYTSRGTCGGARGSERMSSHSLHALVMWYIWMLIDAMSVFLGIPPILLFLGVTYVTKSSRTFFTECMIVKGYLQAKFDIINVADQIRTTGHGKSCSPDALVRCTSQQNKQTSFTFLTIAAYILRSSYLSFPCLEAHKAVI